MKKKNWIIVVLCVAIVGMGIGFAALAQNLQINTTANITGEWDVRITEIRTSWLDGATLVGTPTFDGTSATIEVDLPHPGARAQFHVRVENQGNIDAVLNSITGDIFLEEHSILQVAYETNPNPSDIKFTIGPSMGNINSDSKFIIDAGDYNEYRIMVEWVANPNGETVIPDVTSKTATIAFNFIQNT